LLSPTQKNDYTYLVAFNKTVPSVNPAINMDSIFGVSAYPKIIPLLGSKARGMKYPYLYSIVLHFTSCTENVGDKNLRFALKI